MKQLLSFLYFSHLLSANSGAQSSLLTRFLLLPLIRSVLNNMHEMERILLKTKDINWTVVRPPGLRNLPSSGISGNNSWFLVRHRKKKPWHLNPDQCCCSITWKTRKNYYFVAENLFWHSSRLLSDLALDYDNALVLIKSFHSAVASVIHHASLFHSTRVSHPWGILCAWRQWLPYGQQRRERRCGSLHALSA